MNKRRLLLVAGAAAALLTSGLRAPACAQSGPFDVQVSTQPLGSAFYRHLAFDFGLDIRELVKLERRGFGRGEVVALVLISKAADVNVKEFAKRRLKDKVSLQDLAAEAKLDYPTLQKNVRAIKEGIESKGEENLPPPVYEPSPSPEPARRRWRDRAAPSPSPASSPLVESSPAPLPAAPQAPQ